MGQRPRRARSSRAASDATAQKERDLAELRLAAQQCTGLTDRELQASIKALRKVVSRLSEEALLNMPPEALRELCSKEGASAAAALMVELRTQHPAVDAANLIRRSPYLLTASGFAQYMGKQRNTLQGHSSEVRGAAFAQGGRMLVSVDWRGRAKVWDLREPRACTPLQPPAPGDLLYGVAAHPDGRHVLLGGRRDSLSLLCALDLETGQWVGAQTSPGNWDNWNDWVTSLALAQDGKVAVAGLSQGGFSLWAWSVDEGRPEEMSQYVKVQTGGLGRVRSLAGVPGTDDVVVVGKRVWLLKDCATALPTTRLEGGVLSNPHMGSNFVPSAAAVSPCGAWAVVAGSDADDCRLVVWDLRSKHQQGLGSHETTVATIQVQGGLSISCLAVSPDSRYVVAGDMGGAVTVWDINSHNCVARVEGAHSGGLRCVAFSADGTWMVTGGSDKLLRLWEWRELVQEEGMQVQEESMQLP